MITRIITNEGDPIVDGTGRPAKMVKILFLLVDETGQPADGWDILSGERIAPGPVRAVTDAAGEFSVELWPTSRGEKPLFWNCSVGIDGVADFQNSLVEGGVLQWISFRFGAVTPTPEQYALWSIVTNGVATKAILDAAAGAYADGQCLNVTNDPDTSLNGIWRKSGAGWIQGSFDRVALAETRLTAGEFSLSRLTDIFYIGKDTNPLTGTPITASTFVFADAIPEGGTIISFSAFNPTAGNKDITIRRFSLSGSSGSPTLTKIVGSDDLTLTLSPGLNIFSTNYPVETGEHLGFYPEISAATYNSGTGSSGGYYAASGNQTSFTDADGATTNILLEISFIIKKPIVSVEKYNNIMGALSGLETNAPPGFADGSFLSRQKLKGERSYNLSENFNYGSSPAEFFEWGVGILRGATIRKTAVISRIDILIKYPPTADRVEVMIYSRATSSAGINAPPGLPEDVPELADWKAYPVGALGFAFDTWGAVEIAPDKPLDDSTRSYYVTIRAYDSGNNRVAIGCGRAENRGYSQFERGFYIQGVAGNPWSSLSAAAAVNVSVYETRYSPIIKKQNIGTRFFGGRTEFPFDNSVPKTFRTIFTIAADCDAVRIIFSHAGTAPVSISSAAVAALSTAADFTLSSVSWSAVEFDGDPNGTIPPSPGTQRRGLLLSDWVPLKSVPRSDVAGGLPLIAVSAYIPTAGTLTLSGNSTGSDDFTNWASHPTRPHVMRYNNGDCVTTPANFVDTTNRSTSIIAGVQYKSRNRVVTVICCGDSISDGRGTYLGGNFAFRACDEKQNKAIGFDYCNFAWSGVGASAITSQVQDILQAGITGDILLLPNGTPNSLGTPILSSAIDTLRIQTLAGMNKAAEEGLVPIVWTMLPTNSSVKDYNSSDSLRRAYNDEWRALASGKGGVLVADFDAKLAGVTDGDGQIQMLVGSTSDGIHPNDTGEELLKAVARSAIETALPLIGLSSSALIL